MTSTLAHVRRAAPLLLMLCGSPTWADGTLTHLSGPVSVQKPGGMTVPGVIGTKVSVGDTVVTGAGGFVRMEMTDGGELVLRPDSQLKVEGYTFVSAKPAEDNFVFRMFKGGLRTVTGLIGKRGNREAYQGQTATATIGIRGTQYDMRVCQANCGALADGTYLAVRFGALHTTNALGSLDVPAGKVAFIPSQTPPVMLPRDPGVGFTPPPVIPKLDEKKKVQAAATATATAPDQAKPAASGSGQSTQATSRSGQTASGSSASGTTEASGKTESSGKTEASGSGTGGGGSGGNDVGGKATSQGVSGSSSGANGSQLGGSTTAQTTQTATTTASLSTPAITETAASLVPVLTPPSSAGMECSLQ
jgi:hypothetical protein